MRNIIADTSIISGQSIPVKGCMDIMADMVDTVFSYWRALIICQFLQESSKVEESSLHVIRNAHTTFLLCGTDISSRVPTTSAFYVPLPINSINR